MINKQSTNPTREGRIEFLLIVGVLICIAGNLLLSVGQRVMDKVAVNAAGPTVGLEFWQNLPADVRELDRQMERQEALLEPIIKLHETELGLPDDGTSEEQDRINDRVEAALAEPTRALRLIQEKRAFRIAELKAQYLAQRSDT